MAGSKAVKKVASLVDGLRECWPDFNMTANEFINPTQDSIVKFYERFVNEFGIRTDAIILVLNQHYNQYDYKDYEEIMYVYVLYSCANYLLDSTSLQSFTLTLKDLVNPSDDKNLMTRISLLANYLYFVKIWTQKTILPLKENVWEELNGLDDLSKKIVSLNDHLKSTAFALATNIDTIEKLSHVKTMLNNDITQLEIDIEEHKKDIPKFKHKLQLIEDKNDELTESLEKNMMKHKQLRSLIVDDHEAEALLAEYHKLENDLTEDETNSNKFVKTLEIKTKTDSFLLKNYEDLNNFADTLHLTEVLDTYHLIEQQRSEKERISKEIQTTQKTEKEVRNSKNQLNHMFLESEEKFQDLALQSNTVVQSLHSEITELNKESEEISKQFERTKCESEKLNESLKSIHNCCEEYKERTEKQDAFYETLMFNFLTKKQELDDKILNSMTQIKEIVKRKK